MGNKTNSKFDERQQQIRGKVYTYTWIYTLCFFFINAIIFDEGHQWCSLFNLAFLGAMTSLLISGAILIVKDAYAYIGGNKIMSVISFCAVFLFYIFVIAKDINKDGFITDDKLTTSGCFLIMLPLILLNIILLIIDYKKDNKEYEKSCKKS